MNYLQKLLSLGSQKAPKLIDDVVEVGKKKASAIEPDEVIGKATKATPEAEEIAEAAWREVGPDADPVTYWDAVKRLAAERPKTMAAGLAGLGTAALGMSGGDEQPPQVPFAPKKQGEPKQVLPDNYNDLAQAEANEMSNEVDPGVFKLLGIDPSKSPKKGEQKPEESEGPDYLELLKQAQSGVSENQFSNALLRAGTQAGASIAGLGAGAQVKPDYAMADALEKTSGKPVSDIEKQMSTESSQIKLKQAQEDMKDESKLRDPDSEISKLMAQLASKAGLVPPGSRMSGMALKNSGVNLGTLLATIEAGKARKEAAALSRETRSSDAQDKMAAKKLEDDTKRTDKRKLITEEVEDRSRNINDSIFELDKLIESHGTFEMTGPQEETMKRLIDTIATDMAKLSDPSSVARPSEVELWRKNLSKVGGLQGLGMRNSTAKAILKNFEGEVEKRRQHAYKVRGITPDNNPTPGTEKPADNNSGGGLVKVLPPGGTKPKLIPADQVEAAVKAGGKVVE